MTIEEKIGLFQTLFAGRRDAFGENRRCQKRPLTDTILGLHIEGKRRIGVYLLDPATGGGAEVWFSVVDIDDDVNGLEKAVAIQKAYQSLGLSADIEASKSENSFHLWIFYAEPIFAATVRGIAKHVLSVCGLEGLEVFPKQDKINLDQSKKGQVWKLHLPSPARRACQAKSYRLS